MRDTIFHLSLVDGITSKHVAMIVAFCKQRQEHVSVIYQCTAQQFRSMGCSEKLAQALVTTLSDMQVLERELSLAQKHSISIMTMYDDQYSFLLKEIHNPPVVLYVRGTIPALPYVAFVGSRAADVYGKKVVTSLVKQVVEAGIGIVSGGALGIDTYAHQAALDAHGITVAVLGGGLLRPYPSENKALFNAIVAQGGAVISPFALEDAPAPWKFPVRNRIIAGMASMTVVAQAAVKSGALITAEYALQEGRTIGAIPGQIDNPLSEGVHYLLSQGAKIITKGSDITEEYGVVSEVVGAHDPIKEKVQQNISQEKKEEDPLELLCSVPTSVMDLSLKMGLSEDVIMEKLFILQLEGRVEQDFAGLWQKV